MLIASLLSLTAVACSVPAEDPDESGGTTGEPLAGQGGATGAAGSTAPSSSTADAGGTGGAGGAGGAAGPLTPSMGGAGAGGAPDSMPVAGAGGAAGAAGAAGSVAMDDHVSPCIDAANDVVLIGDSYIDWITHTFVADIRAESGKEWPSYAIGGTSMATGGIGHIPDQLVTALADNPAIKAVVMTGGGNDILVADTIMFPDATMCTSTPTAPMIPDCQAIVKAATDEATNLMNDTADAGVRDVVYFFYPHIPGGGLISGPTPNPMLDYALPRAREVCESALERTAGRMKCHFVDMVPVFEGKMGLFADAVSEAGDGVHPNSMGSKVIAQEVWRVMKQECIAQPSGSGCCQEP